MASEGFEASMRDRSGTAVIDMKGEINRSAEAALRAAYADAVAKRPGGVLLNFDDVHYINSTGIAVIVGLLAEARKSGLSITACGLSDHYKEIFEITRLSDFMRIFDDEENAVADVPA
jgi:anti-anti-sigma factor